MNLKNSTRLLGYKEDLHRYLNFTLLFLLFIYPIYIGALQLAEFKNGTQGIDFAIFSQIIFQVGEHNRFLTSLISTGWEHFLTHHLSPYLYLLGWINKLGIPPEILLIGAHVLAVAFLVLGIYKIFFLKVEDSLKASLLTLAVILLPAVRIGLAWETHDEILALPFLIWSIYAHLTNRHNLKLALLFLSLFFKETLGLNIFCFSLFYAIDSQRYRVASLTSAFFGALVFVLYVKIFPHWLWYPTFDGMVRISTLRELLEPDSVLAKARWLCLTLLPSLPLIFLHSKRTFLSTLLLLVPATYNFGAILISNFPNMYEPYNYYSITPALLAFLAFSLPVVKSPKLYQGLGVSFFLLSITGTSLNQMKMLDEAFSTQSARAEIRHFVPKDSVVIADDRIASLFSECKQIIRIYHANRALPKFDFIVLEKGEKVPLSLYLRSWSKPCAETKRYLVRCGLDKVKTRH